MIDPVNRDVVFKRRLIARNREGGVAFAKVVARSRRDDALWSFASKGYSARKLFRNPTRIVFTSLDVAGFTPSLSFEA